MVAFPPCGSINANDVELLAVHGENLLLSLRPNHERHAHAVQSR